MTWEEWRQAQEEFRASLRAREVCEDCGIRPEDIPKGRTKRFQMYWPLLDRHKHPIADPVFYCWRCWCARFHGKSGQKREVQAPPPAPPPAEPQAGRPPMTAEQAADKIIVAFVKKRSTRLGAVESYWNVRKRTVWRWCKRSGMTLPELRELARQRLGNL